MPPRPGRETVGGESTVAEPPPWERAGAARERPTWGLVEGDAIAPGRTVLRQIGGGRRYEVFLVWDAQRLSVLVAKVLRPDHATDAVALRDLVREGDLLARISHPVVVRGFDTAGGGPFPHLLLEHLEGPTLQALLDRHGPVGLEQLLPLGMHVAAALHYLAHEGVVHLDVKPDNLVMGAPPRLIDFSVSRGLISAGAALQAGRHRRLHGPGAVRPHARRARPARGRVRARRDDVPRDDRRAAVPARPGRRALAGPGGPLPAARARAGRAAAPHARPRWPSCWRRCSPRRPATARRPRRSSPRSSPSSRSCRGGSCSAAAAACAASPLPSGAC